MKPIVPAPAADGEAPRWDDVAVGGPSPVLDHDEAGRIVVLVYHSATDHDGVQVVASNPYSPLAQSLTRSLERAGFDVPVQGVEDMAVLRVLSEEWDSQPISVDQFGRAQEYTLRYAAVFRLEAADGISQELIPERHRSKTMSSVLDAINRRYGNNALYFGAMKEAITHGAAPMRIPFSTIPDTALEEVVSAS